MGKKKDFINEDTGDNVKDALKNDWEQTKNDIGAGGRDLDQDVDDTLRQAVGKEDPDRKGFTS